jgi:hypothetical protein
VDKAGGSLKPNTGVKRIEGGRVVLANYLTGREELVEDVAAVVWVGLAIPHGSTLAAEIEGAGIERRNIHIVGDAFQPRRLVNALVEAHGVARGIGSKVR